MKRLFSMATTALTIKALWWDKLSPEKKQEYTNKAKDLFHKNKDVITTKGKAFVDANKDVLAAKGEVLVAKGKEFAAEKKADLQEKKVDLEVKKDDIESETKKDSSSHPKPFDPLSDNGPGDSTIRPVGGTADLSSSNKF